MHFLSLLLSYFPAHTLRLEMIAVNGKVIAFVWKVWATQKDWILVMKLVVKLD
jgi:hypothetical protein